MDSLICYSWREHRFNSQLCIASSSVRYVYVHALVQAFRIGYVRRTILVRWLPFDHSHFTQFELPLHEHRRPHEVGLDLLQYAMNSIRRGLAGWVATSTRRLN